MIRLLGHYGRGLHRFSTLYDGSPGNQTQVIFRRDDRTIDPQIFRIGHTHSNVII
jgi:hypothetical protein